MQIAGTDIFGCKVTYNGAIISDVTKPNEEKEWEVPLHILDSKIFTDDALVDVRKYNQKR